MRWASRVAAGVATLTLLGVLRGGKVTSPAIEKEPLRLKVQGSKLLQPSGEEIRLTGFNWVLGHEHPGEGKYMQSILPHANVVRVVGLLWDDNPSHPGGDCRTDAPPYFKEHCFKDLDKTIQLATDAGLWVILTGRGETAAGQQYSSDPQSDVFHNATLRTMMYTMWKHVAEHYKTWDYIAAYEIMSEPRDKGASAQDVHSFYEGGCAAVQAVDPATPCMVGSRDYYKLWTFPEITPLSSSNVIYTFDYFTPDKWVFGKSDDVTTYGDKYKCSELYAGWQQTCCDSGAATELESRRLKDELMTFDAAWSRKNFLRYASPIREKYNVPIFVNQWGVVHGLSAAQGRYAYMRDMAALFKEFDIGWTWWVWSGGGSTGWKHGSMEFVYHYDNGTVAVDQQAVDAVKEYM